MARISLDPPRSLLVRLGDQADAVGVLDVDGGRITGLRLVRNPDKLRGVLSGGRRPTSTPPRRGAAPLR